MIDNKKLMNILQQGLPIENDPYGIIADNLGATKAEVLDSIKTLTEEGYIRRLGGTFDTNAMGFNSMLIGAHVEEEIFYEVAAYVNASESVTHNYRRPGYLNMWFTFSTEQAAKKAAFIEALKDKFQLEDVLEFPNLNNFKLHVFFDMESR